MTASTPATPLHWLAVIGLVALFAIAWIATAMGLATGTAAGAASLAGILQILPFLSGAFVPTDTMPGWLQAFTANQPMTHMVTALRSLLANAQVGDHWWIALPGSPASPSADTYGPERHSTGQARAAEPVRSVPAPRRRTAS